MSASQEFLLRWRGRQSGPYPLTEINRLLDEHEIGMEHEIQFQNGWVTLEEFMESHKPAAREAAPLARPSVASEPATLSGAAEPLDGSPPPRMPRPQPALTPPLPQAPQTDFPAMATPATGRARHRLVYALLAILLGFSGLHNFYARHWLTGAVQFLVSCVSFLLGFGIIIPWIWALVEAVVVHKDGREIEMS